MRAMSASATIKAFTEKHARSHPSPLALLCSLPASFPKSLRRNGVHYAYMTQPSKKEERVFPVLGVPLSTAPPSSTLPRLCTCICWPTTSCQSTTAFWTARCFLWPAASWSSSSGRYALGF